MLSARVFADTPIKIDEVRIEVVIDLEFAGRLVEEDPPTAAEYFDIPVTFSVESDDDFFSQGFLTAHPAHKTVHAFLSQGIAKKISRIACLFSQYDLDVL